MKKNLAFALLISLITSGLTSCKNNSPDNKNSKINVTSSDIYSKPAQESTNTLFDDVYALIPALSQNGLGQLKDWSSPMSMGYGSFTGYHQIGNNKDNVGLQNSIAYFVNGTDYTANKLTINLIINNPTDKNRALKFLKEITEKTFKSIKLEIPEGLTNAILSYTPLTIDIQHFTVNFNTKTSDSETCIVEIIRK